MNKSLNLLCKTAITSTLLVALPIQADENKPFEYSGLIILMSDFVDRGMSFTAEDPAVIIDLNIEHESGFDVGISAFNVNFLEDETVRAGDRANVILGPYVGYRGDLSDNLSIDIQGYRYRATGAAKDLNYDYTEFTGILTYSIQDTDLGFTYDYSPNFFFEGGKAPNYEFSISHSLANDLSFGGYVGQQLVSDNESVGFEDYFHYNVWASYPIGDFDATVFYSDTNLPNAKDMNSDSRVYFMLSASF